MKDKQVAQERVIADYIFNPPAAMYILGVGEKTEAETLHMIYPDMQIFGCEPNPYVVNRIRSRFPGTLFEAGISNQEKEMLYFDMVNTKNGSFQKPPPLLASCNVVDCVTLDRFDEMCGQPDNILLWADIEGWELIALQSGMKLLESSRVKWINLECRGYHNPTSGYPTGAELTQQLSPFDYIKVVEYNDHKTHHDVIYRHKDAPCLK